MSTALSGTTFLIDSGTTVLDDGSTVTGTVYLDAGHVLDIAGRVTSSQATFQLGNSGGATSAGGGAIIIDYPAHLGVVDGGFYDGSGNTLFQNNGYLSFEHSGVIEVPFVNVRTLTVNSGVLFFSGSFADSSNRGIINNDSAIYLESPKFYNAGTFNNIADLDMSGAPEAASFVNQKNGTFNFIDDYSVVADAGLKTHVFTNYGHVAKTSGTKESYIDTSYIGIGGDISIATGSFLLAGRYNSIQSETISGPGKLEVGYGAHVVLGAGTTVETGSLSVFSKPLELNSYRSFLRLDEDLGYKGTYSQDEASLVLGSHTLTLSGATSFSGVRGAYSNIEGSGTLVVAGPTGIGGTNLLGSAVLRNTGTVGQTGNVGVGDPTNQAASIINAAGATWKIYNDALIAAGNAQATFVNDGTLIKRGSAGLSVVGASVRSSAGGAGLLAVQDGSLELVRDVSGHEAMQTQGSATLILNAGASADTSFSFIGMGGTLQLEDAADFHGSISDFVAGDVLDLRSVAFSGQSPAYQGSSPSSGTLTLSDGTHSAALTLLGAYTPTSFHASSDQHGGTFITVV